VKRIALLLARQITIWLAALVIAVLLAHAPVIEDGAEVIAADKADAIEEAKRVASVEPAP